MDRIIKKSVLKKQDKRYFTQETEDAILDYNNTNNYITKSKIYERYIHYPFFKLTQNIIHNFKFYHTDVDDLEHLQHEIIVFLLSKIHLYHHSTSLNRKFKKIITKKHKEKYIDNSFIEFTNNAVKVDKDIIINFINTLKISDECRNELLKLTPPKAFSYFGTITKRYLITYNQKNYDNKINNISIQDLNNSLSPSPDNIITTPNKNLNFLSIEDFDEEENFEKNNSNDKLSVFLDQYIEHCSQNLKTIFPKKNDSQIADAILELFRKRDNITIFNKKALYLYIREMINVKTPKITKISKKLYDIYKDKYYYYLENGEFPKG